MRRIDSDERQRPTAVTPSRPRGSDGAGFNIWSVSVADGSTRQLTDFKGSSKQLGLLSSDGQRFYLLLHERVGDLWVAELLTED
ncbi:hypothetical protein IID10_03610 [candidate division KSB1 bacterium]|nr:hypothetical protein [candidate division KSB1 bacterium]